MYSFMQIYGNCTAVHCLGLDRIKGPVDNVQTKNYQVMELLLNGGYFDYIKNAHFEKSSRPAGFDGDSDIAYSTPIVRIVHNNPSTQKYLENLAIRCENFKNFIAHLDKDKFLIYSINVYDLKKDHTLRKHNLINNIEYLKKVKLLDKVIFIGSVGDSWSNFWSDELIPIIKKYNLKYIEMVGIKAMRDVTPGYFEQLYDQFYKKAAAVIENGTAGEYLVAKQKRKANNKRKKPTAKNVYNVWQELEDNWKISQ